MDPRLADARASARGAVGEALEALTRWLEIPSVSGDPRRAADVRDAARWCARRLRRWAHEVDVVEADAGPVVVARVRGVRRARGVAFYGHLDVRPGGPGWSSPPFVPTLRGHRLHARGASDDKGQVMAAVAAVEAWVAVGGPPGDVVLVVDGAEEVGSPGVGRALREVGHLRHGARPVPWDVVVVDTRAAAPGVPSLTVAQRGRLMLRATVDAGRPAVHPGRYGGLVQDPTLLLGAALQRAHRQVVGRRALGGGASLAVTSVRAGDHDGAVPRSASATVDVRLPPHADPARALEVVRAAAGDVVPSPARLLVEARGSAQGHELAPPAAAVRAVRGACLRAFGAGPVPVRSGGSIAAVPALARCFGSDPVLLGLAAVHDGAHGPDEHLDVREWVRAVDALVCVVGAGRPLSR